MLDDTEVRRIVNRAVADEVFPGGVLFVADRGAPVLELAFGRLARVPAPGPPVTLDTVYDVASVTKAAVTSLLALRLVADGELDWDTPARGLVPEAPAAVRVADLLAHASGLPAWRPLYERLAGEVNPREAIVRLAAAEPLERAPGAASVYSDLGFIVLGAVIERAAGRRLDELAAQHIFAPLSMTRSGFVNLFAAPPAPRPSPVAATEVCPRRGLLAGEVHDDNCHAGGGILGHAGLFATAGDLSRLAAALVAAWHGRAAPFPPAAVRTLMSPSGVPGSTWRLGWDGPAPSGSQAGERWPKSGVGHLGYTGCSLWIDLPRERWVVLLTNRVHPRRGDERIKQVRPALHDAVLGMLDLTPPCRGLPSRPRDLRKPRFRSPGGLAGRDVFGVTFAPLAVPVEIRALDVGARLVRAFRLSAEITEDALRLERDLPFEAGRPVAALLQLPDDETALQLTGVVTAVGSGDDPPRPRGVAFASLDADARRRLSSYVTERIRLP